MTDFPTLSQGQDSQFFQVELEDVTMGSEMEGGYVVTRPRHTRKPRRTFTTGFTDVSEADRQTFEAFLDTVRMGSNSFNWTNPVTGAVHVVRIKKGTVPSIKYKGFGGNHRWNITEIKLEEV